MPIVADCAAVRQNRATSVIGLGSLTESEKPDWRPLRDTSCFSVRRCVDLVLTASMDS